LWNVRVEHRVRKSRHQSWHWIQWIQPTCSLTISLRPILITSHLRIVLRRWHFQV